MFQVSPGVNISEIDTTTVIPSVATSTGAIAGEFNWGPANTTVLVSSENQLVSTFGKPSNGNTANVFLTAASFLAYANDLRVVRALLGGANNAVSNSNASNAIVSTADIQFENEIVYEGSGFLTGQLDAANNNFSFVSRYPGTLGNSLKVSILDRSANTNVSAWVYGSYFDRSPNTSNYLSQSVGATLANDEMHIVVIDKDGLFTGKTNTVLEIYPSVSKASNARDETGQSIYYKDVLFRKSKYIYAGNYPANTTGGNANWGTTANSSTVYASLCGRSASDENGVNFLFYSGTNGTHSDAAIQNAYSKFINSEEIDVSFLITADHNSTVKNYVIGNIAEVRKDCVAFVSPSLTSTQSITPSPENAIKTERQNINPYSSYAMMDSGWKYMYDKYNDVYRWVPLNGDIAGLCARTDQNRDPWWSPAGSSRGQIKNFVKLSFNPSKAQRDELYKNDINPVVSFSGEGTMLYGDKTLLGRPSAFDRINVRRLFIVLEKSIARAARSSLFEFNDEFTRAQFVNLVEPFLRNVKGRRGIYDYRVVCDTTNNTPEVIDRNEFVGDIYVKPAKSINFIQLNFVAVRTGVAFEEIVGRF